MLSHLTNIPVYVMLERSSPRVVVCSPTCPIAATWLQRRVGAMLLHMPIGGMVSNSCLTELHLASGLHAAIVPFITNLTLMCAGCVLTFIKSWRTWTACRARHQNHRFEGALSSVPLVARTLPTSRPSQGPDTDLIPFSCLPIFLPSPRLRRQVLCGVCGSSATCMRIITALSYQKIEAMLATPRHRYYRIVLPPLEHAE
ncbi:hypothetical protein L227DRAFT_358191 [Lentinus tigrinus ALCF2SS1-6]|uniref:Uncharacterized protein n=1 Tax=Lentinus tigrinus ALCF2SS1-6 TaxID=1328759 RepID=A0A5C2SQC7_9APHY|nr:hypothetical protein L227DRAFT_358191 [Lentinus tigrinus ALCF2SS1-6]